MTAASITKPPATTTAAYTSARLVMMLTDLRLPTIKRLAGEVCAQSDTNGWPAHQLLKGLAGAWNQRTRGSADRPPPQLIQSESGQTDVQF